MLAWEKHRPGSSEAGLSPVPVRAPAQETISLFRAFVFSCKLGRTASSQNCASECFHATFSEEAIGEIDESKGQVSGNQSGGPGWRSSLGERAPWLSAPSQSGPGRAAVRMTHRLALSRVSPGLCFPKRKHGEQGRIRSPNMQCGQPVPLVGLQPELPV